MKRLVLVLLVPLAGCANLPSGAFSNRVACTVAGDSAVYVSMYGQIGVTSKIDDLDASVLCKAPS